MLCKLLKHDFKSMLRTFIPLWVIVLIFSLGNYAISAEPFSGSGTIATIIVTALLIAVGTITVVLVIQRFYQGLLKDEGYLMFTLPVRSWQLVLSKYITALSTVILSYIVGATAIFLLVTKGILSKYMWEQAFSVVTGEFTPLLLLLALSTLVGIMSTIALAYLSMAIGHLFYKHRIPIAIATYIAISTVVSKVTELLFDNEIINTISVEFATSFSLDDLSTTLINAGFFVTVAFSAVVTIIYLGVTIAILDKRLNLE